MSKDGGEVYINVMWKLLTFNVLSVGGGESLKEFIGRNPRNAFVDSNFFETSETYVLCNVFGIGALVRALAMNSNIF